MLLDLLHAFNKVIEKKMMRMEFNKCVVRQKCRLAMRRKPELVQRNNIDPSIISLNYMFARPR